MTSQDEQRLEPDRCRRASNALKKVLIERKDLIHELRDEIRRYLSAQVGKSPSEPTLSRMFKRGVPRRGDFSLPAATYVEQLLLPFLTDRGVSEDLVQAVSIQLNPVTVQTPSDVTRSAKASGQPAPNAPLPTSGELTAVALNHLFTMTKKHYSVSSAMEGEYFGYRWSANQGHLVRFYITIRLSDAEGLIRFRARYRREETRKVEGCGFDLDGTTTLLGHVTSDTGMNSGFGLQFLSLVKYGHFDWITGVLLTMANYGDPIAARVVLVPAEQHKRYKNSSEEGRHDIMLEMIGERLKALEVMDDEIEIQDVDGRNPFATVPCSVHIQSLIWNGTFTTLHTRQVQPTRELIPYYNRLGAFQKRAITYGKFARLEIAPFIAIMMEAPNVIPENKELIDDFEFEKPIVKSPTDNK